MATRLTIVDGNNNDKDNVRVYMVKGEKGGATWGQIDGIVSDQTDINAVIDTKIETELANFEHLDYRVVDTIPTPATAEEGVRYLYKPAGATAYNEYILIDGVIYMIGTTEDVDLSDYYNKVEIDDKIKNTKQTTGTATDTYSTDYLNKALQRHIMTACTHTTATVQNNGTVPFNNILKVGDKLTFNSSDNTIVIGTGVSKILVSGKMTITSTMPMNQTHYFSITVNGNESYAQGRVNKTITSTPFDANTPPFIFEVQEGDKIGMKYATSQTGTLSNNISGQTWVTVEVIE